jgi:hypothetical protein
MVPSSSSVAARARDALLSYTATEAAALVGVVVEAAISAAMVRANQLPRIVSRAEALLPSTVRVNMPSRLRSAIVIPKIGF